MTGNHPYRHGTRQGPLPLLLIAVTVVTGVVDAFAFLALGPVFVANLTGTVVLLGVALVGASGTTGVAVGGCLLSLTAFGLGALAAARLLLPRVYHRGHLLAIAVGGQLALVAGATAVAAEHGTHQPASRAELITLLALAMGVQHATVRRLAVPDLSGGGLTRTVTALVTEPQGRRILARRATSVVAMLAGALLGGLAARLVTVSAPLFLASALLVGVMVATERYARRPDAPAWAGTPPARPLATVRALPAGRTPVPRPVLPAAPVETTHGPPWPRGHPDATTW